MAAGLISEADAETHPKKNVLLGAFRITEDLEPEVLSQPVCIEEGDAFLICTDGVWTSVSSAEIALALQTSVSVESWVRTLEQSVKNARIEDKDNYTMIGVWITSSDDRTLRLD